ncbi:hypothetical protein ACFSKI_19000 [Pseudogracilibacillus auburnensis]|uniref:Uncharacterized protein n=1 Tax=Pseudogracilibacillus auburnensis TaxID=1494959 RepID=A0A2V3W6H6_9BACI|nr:hypothetical protein [Pseudogracilibacillus auburnensis]PXW88784.1 hypothetical protein DFR56_103290 [Pseudogracilibacillus auburnensis]
MLKVKGFKFGIGDVVVPVNLKGKPSFLKEVIVDDICEKDFLYSVVDHEGDCWQVSPIALENEFILLEGA